MKVGILGGGNISETHARAASSLPGVEIAAVCGRRREKAVRLASAYGAAAYDDLGSFLAHRPMDLVAIGSPSGLHAEQGIAAAARGLHVLVEKPIDITTARADALIAAADRAGVKLGVFFQDRTKPDVRRMKGLCDDGLGKPILAAGRVKWYRSPEYYAASSWRGTWALDGGGALMNQAIHTLDLLLWMLGPLQSVMGRTATRQHAIETEDTAAAVLEFASGALGIFEAATSVFPGYARRIEITGSEGTLALEGDYLVAIDMRTPPEPADSSNVAPAGPSDVAPAFRPATNTPQPDARATSPVIADVSGHRAIFEDFIRAIESDGRPLCDGREARPSVEAVEAIYASARAGRPIELEGSRVRG